MIEWEDGNDRDVNKKNLRHKEYKMSRGDKKNKEDKMN